MKSVETAFGVLEHVGVVAKDIDSVRRLFEGTLRLPAIEDKRGGFASRAGRTMIRVLPADAPGGAIGRPGWHHLAFRVRSLGEARAQLENGGVRFLDGARPGTNGRKALWTDPATTIGIPLQLIEEATAFRFDTRSDCLIERVDHLGVACRSAPHARHVYVDLMGYPLESTQTDSEVLIPVETTSNDKYGASTHVRAPIPAVGAGLMADFVTVGDFDLEIMQPLSKADVKVPLGTVPGTVGQDQGAIARYLERHGEGLLHMCFKTPDIRAALASVIEDGVRLIDPVARPGGRSGLIAFMDRRSTQGLLMHFVERTPL
jgi:catechol 2,3-dioxygenase-like lactoylglutathione lyase family enzyme